MSKDGQYATGAVARSSGRGSLPLVINKTDRKPLFAETSSRDNIEGADRGKLRPGVGRNAHSDGSALLADAGSGASASANANHLARSVSPTPSMGSSNGDGSSRIPRPASAAGGAFSKARKQISLTEAYRMAEAEEQRGYSPTRFRQSSPVAVDGSPSPAPRPRPVSQASNDGRANRALNREPTDVGKSRRHSRPLGDPIPEDDTRQSIETSSSLSSFERRLSRFAEDQRRSSASPSQRPGFDGHSRIPARLGENQRTLARKTSDSSLGGSPQPPAFAKGHVPKGWVAHLLAQEEKRATSPQPQQTTWQDAADRPIPSIEGGNSPQEPTPPKSRPTTAGAENSSPNKSYAWQVDQDFTAGDLQISDSPRITTDLAELGSVGARRSSNDAAFGHNQGIDVGNPETARGGHPSPRRSGSRRSNTKLDEIWQRERDMELRVAERPERHQPRARNTKLDDIRQREVELQLEPEEEGMRAEHDEERDRPRNTKLDEIREREKEFMSKKALASNRLDDIREQNSMSKSLSPEPQVQRSKPAARDSTPDKASVGSQDPSPGKKGKGGGQGQGEQIHDTPITVFRKAGTEAQDKPDDRRQDNKESKDSDKAKQQTPHVRSDSRDLLRRLARATSTSPAPEPKKQPGSPGRDGKDVATASSNKGDKNSEHSRRGSSETRRPPAADGRRHRVPSTDSTKDKRSSRALSDNDPTDRIEGEMMLFAPGDNQSERGSVRAPSLGPPSEDEDELPEETPRATKKDPLSLPTPRVTGAYVETPVAVKVENREEDNEARSEKLPVTEQDKAAPRASRKSSKDQRALTLSDKSETRGSGLRRRRTRSLPRSRGPLINSAKPPTVRDDLLAIQKTYKIEDSTLDDFEQLFKTGKRAPSPELESVLNEISVRREKIANKPDFDKSDNSELERYDRMSKSLKDGLMGIRTAKLGIERLEGNLAHADQAPKLEDVDELELPVELPKPRRGPEAELSSRKASLKASSGTSSGASVKEDKKKRHETATSCTDDAAPTSDVPGVTYLYLPVPRLYRRKPFRFTLLGLLLLVFSIWYAAESATCANYCRPETCYPKRAPCYWSPSDPTWGYAIPVKLDQWLTDGQGRDWAHHLATEASDMYLDVWEYVTDTDIRDVDMETLGFYGKRQHRRRLRKKGLVKPRVETPEEKAKWDALHEMRLAMERAQEMREAGYDVGDDYESFRADERV